MAVQRLPRAKKSTVAQNVIFAKKDQSHQCVKKKKPATVVVAFKEKLRAGVESLLASSATNYDACLGLAFDALKAATRRKLHQINVTVLFVLCGVSRAPRAGGVGRAVHRMLHRTTAAQACHIPDTESGTPLLLAVAATSIPVSRISPPLARQAAQSEPRVRAAVASLTEDQIKINDLRGDKRCDRLPLDAIIWPVDLFRPNPKRFMFLCQRRIQSRTATATCFCAQPDIDKRPLDSPDQRSNPNF
jgi:hypothetical protein